MKSNNQLETCNFMVCDRPFCIWDVGLSEKNLNSIKAISADFFDYIANLHVKQLDTDNKQLAALAIRMAYHHSLETLFSLICATIQAPICIYAWLLKYQIKDIRELLQNANKKGFSAYNHPFHSKEISSWKDFSFLVFRCDKNSGHEDIAVLFAKFWDKLSVDFTDEAFHQEYNGIKHGYRCKPGGFALSFGPELEPGKPCPNEKMKLLGKSDYGSSFYVAEKFGNPMKKDPNFKTTHRSLGWNAEGNAHALVLISMSISNIKSYLLSINSKIQEIQYIIPEDENYFERPWESAPTLPKMQFNLNFKEHLVHKKQSDEIIDSLHPSNERKN